MKDSPAELGSSGSTATSLPGDGWAGDLLWKGLKHAERMVPSRYAN